MNRLAVVSLLLGACVCPPTTHVEQTYAPPSMADSINLCATENSCTVLCSRAFLLEANVIDSCRITSLDHNGGAYLEVKWNEYVCQVEEWSTDDGWDDGSDYGDYGDDDYDPCSDGSCDPTGGDEDPPPDDPPPDDPPPDDEPPPDDDPPMDEGL